MHKITYNPFLFTYVIVFAGTLYFTTWIFLLIFHFCLKELWQGLSSNGLVFCFYLQ